MIDLNLTGRRAVVTGASLGIGAATVRLLADHGAEVAFCARSEDAVNALDGYQPSSGDGSAGGHVADMADRSSIDAFFEVPWVNPTGQTILITNLLELEGAADRQHAIEQVLGLESLDEGRFFVQASQMLAWLHKNEAPIARLLRGERTLVALTEDGRQVIPLPVDHILWTPELAELLDRRGPQLDARGVRSRELWLIRTASELCKAQLESRGWRVETRLGDRMRALDAESEHPRAGRAP